MSALSFPRLPQSVFLTLVALPLTFSGPRAFSATPIPRGMVAGVPSAVHDSLPLDEVRRTAHEAYVWGWALVYLHQCRASLERVPAPGRCGGIPVAPLNRLSMLTDVIRPRTTIVPCANQDVIYGFGMFDLADDAVVLQVPDFGERFWLYQLGDHRTDAFAEVGRMHGTKPGCYLIVGPDWEGDVPVGISAVFRCPTRYGYCLPRIHVDGSDDDKLAVLPVVNGIMAYPLAEYDGSPRSHDWSQFRWLPNLAGRGRHREEVSPESFFAALPQVLADVPPLPGEEALYERIRRLVRAIELRPEIAVHAVAAATDAENEVVGPLFEFRNVGRALPAHWTTVDNGASFGADYLTRTAVAKSNVFVNAAHEARYYYLDLDAHGERLDGARHYRLTFPAGALPPARAFWSLTVYDERHALPSGAGRHAIGSHTPGIELAADGSLTILVGPGPADGEPASANRLISPEGDFSLYLRIYWPDEAASDGSWSPPPVLSLAEAGRVAVDGRHEDDSGDAAFVAIVRAAVRVSTSAGPVNVDQRRSGGASGRRALFGRGSDREIVRRR